MALATVTAAASLAACTAAHSGTMSPQHIGVTVFTAASAPPAPAVSGPLLGGGKLSLASERGHVVVLNFWGSWCTVCQQEGPALAAAARRYEPAGVRFLGVDVADFEPGAAEAFEKRYRISYPSLSDPKEAIALKFASLVPVAAFPSTLVISRTGQVSGRVIGQVSSQDLTRLIAAAGAR